MNTLKNLCYIESFVNYVNDIILTEKSWVMERKQHLEGILEHGITQYHRKSYGRCKDAPLNMYLVEKSKINCLFCFLCAMYIYWLCHLQDFMMMK